MHVPTWNEVGAVMLPGLDALGPLSHPWTGTQLTLSVSFINI